FTACGKKTQFFEPPSLPDFFRVLSSNRPPFSPLQALLGLDRNTTPRAYCTGTDVSLGRGINFTILTKLWVAMTRRNIQSTRSCPRSLVCLTGRSCLPQPKTFSTSLRLL